MRTKFDQMGKQVLARMSESAGTMESQREIVIEPQAADLWFEPAPERAAARDRLGLLGRMLAAPCLLEYFSATPSANEVLDCVSKQLNLRRMRWREAARHRPRAGSSPDVMPRLWILSAGRPGRAMRELALVPMDGWPSGLWQAPSPLLHLHLVVLRDLPEGRETLLLRILGRGRTFQRAMHELHELPIDAWEVELAIPLLLAFRIEIFQDSGEGRMQHANEMQAIYDEWERRVKHASWRAGEEAGRKAGRLKTLRESLRVVYQARFGALPPEVQEAIESMEEPDTLLQWNALFATRAPEEIAALVRGR